MKMSTKKLVRRAAILLLIYIAIVGGFESLIGYFQPADASTLVLTTRTSSGDRHDRVITRLNSQDQLYVAVNHWPRAWYRRALKNDEVEVDLGDGKGKRPYRAVLIKGEEYDRVNLEHNLPIAFLILTGFPPRHIFRLDPRSS